MNVRVCGVGVRHGKILLIKYDYKEGPLWHIPGGGPEYKEPLTDALEREFREELSLTVQVGALRLACDSIRPHDRIQVLHCLFHVVIDGDAIPELQVEHSSGQEFQWVPTDELSELRLYPNVGKHLQQLLEDKRNVSTMGYIGQIRSA